MQFLATILREPKNWKTEISGRIMKGIEQDRDEQFLGLVSERSEEYKDKNCEELKDKEK